MVEFTGREIGEVIGIRAAIGAQTAIDARITGWSVDSRTVAAGDLFFALRGPNHDGNAYIADALRKGAVAAIIDEQDYLRENDTRPLLIVPNSLVALQKIAAWARNEWNGEV